jgi:hypothetical protein
LSRVVRRARRSPLSSGVSHRSGRSVKRNRFAARTRVAAAWQASQTSRLTVTRLSKPAAAPRHLWVLKTLHVAQQAFSISSSAKYRALKLFSTSSNDGPWVLLETRRVVCQLEVIEGRSRPSTNACWSLAQGPGRSKSRRALMNTPSPPLRHGVSAQRFSGPACSQSPGSASRPAG